MMDEESWDNGTDDMARGIEVYFSKKTCSQFGTEVTNETSQ